MTNKDAFKLINKPPSEEEMLEVFNWFTKKYRQDLILMLPKGGEIKLSDIEATINSETDIKLLRMSINRIKKILEDGN